MFPHHRSTRALVLLATGLLLSACSQKEDEGDKGEPAIPVATRQVIRGTISASYKGTSTIHAAEEASVVAKLPGVLEHIAVEEGQRVAAGEALARLDDERLSLELARAEARHQQLLNEHQRQQSVLAKHLISKDAYERTRFELAAAKAELDLARLNLRESVIRAPIAGVVARRLVKTGNMLQLHAPLFLITDLSQLQADLHVPERDIRKLAPGQRAQLRVDAWPEELFSGQVLRINPVVDGGSGTVKVTIALANSQGRLLPGMFGRIEVAYDKQDDALLIPKGAVQIEDALASVFVIIDNKAQRRPVTLGYSNTQYYQVISGLEEGDQVVTTGRASLKDGALVDIVEHGE